MNGREEKYKQNEKFRKTIYRTEGPRRLISDRERKN